MKKGVINLVLFVFIFIFLVGCVNAACPDNQRIMRLSANTNAHGELWNKGNYGIDVCSPAGETIDHNTNPIIYLSANTNAHASTSQSVNYNIPIYFGNQLVCLKKTSCNSDEKTIVSLSANTNAHLALGDNSNYPIKICCKPGLGNIYWADMNENQITEADIGDTVKLIALNVGSFDSMNPELVGGIISGSYLDHAYDVQVSGNYAYVTGWYSEKLAVVDISNPSNPQIISNVENLTYMNSPHSVFISGNYAYVVALDSNSLAVVDISNPSNPKVVGGVKDSTYMGGAFGIYVSGNYAYVTGTLSNSLAVVDISNPSNPKVVGGVKGSTYFSGGTHGVYVSGNYAYVTGMTSDSLAVVDISNPSNPTIINGITDSTSLNGASGVYVSGNYAYVTTTLSNSLAVVDISNPSNPQIVTGLTDSNYFQGPYRVYVSGNYAYVTGMTSDSLAIVDISSPLNPIVANGIKDSTYMDGARGIYVSGNYAYVTGMTSDSLAIIKVLSVSDDSSVVFDIKEADAINDDDIESIEGIIDLEGKAVATWTITQSDFDKGTDGGFEVGENEFYFEVLGKQSEQLLVDEDSADDEDSDSPLNLEIVSPKCGGDIDLIGSSAMVEFKINADDADDFITGEIDFGDGSSDKTIENGMNFISHTYTTSGNFNIIARADSVRSGQKRDIINIMIIDTSQDGTYIAACIDKPEDLSNIEIGSIEFDATSTRAIRFIASSQTKEEIPLENLKFNWRFSASEKVYNCLFEGNSRTCGYEGEIPVASPNQAGINGAYFWYTYLESGDNWATLEVSI